ncbi:MAG TPA: hypothetical protein VHB99_01900 [Pirellulales bacterium]|nr:hypothetical protein [Pirellulales bacterium]
MDVPQIRQRVLEAIEARRLGSSALIGENVMVQGGYYIGRRFIFEDVEAVWRVDSDQVSLFTNDGESLPPVLLQAGASERPAA